MAIHLGAAYVDIVPSTRGLGRELSRELSGAAGSAGEAAGEAASVGFGSRFTARAGKIATKAAKGIAVAGAAAITATLAKAVTSGWDRLVSLERAEKMLSQMGISAGEVERLMGGLNDTLTGTAFALDEGASSMANLISAGVGLDDVNRQLDLIADAAAYGQAPLAEIADIFRQITTEGKLTGRELRMLHMRGIPAAQVLAAGLGVAAEEISGMVSRSEIDAETFVNAWEKGAKGFGDAGIVMEGSAKSMGDTVMGAFGNAKTALARFGAELLGPVFRRAPAVIEALTNGLNSLKDGVGPLYDTLGGLDFGRVWKSLERVVPILRDVAQSFMNLARIGLDGLPAALQLFASALEVALRVLQPVASILEKVTGFLADHSTLILTVGAAWLTWKAGQAVVKALGDGVDNLAVGLFNLVSKVSRSSIGDLLGGVVDMTKAMTSSDVPAAGKLMGDSFQAGATRAKSGLKGLSAGLSRVAGPAAIGMVMAFAGAWKRAGDIASAEMDRIKSSADDTLDGLGGIVTEAVASSREAAEQLRSTSEGGGSWFDIGLDAFAMTVENVGSALGVMEPKMATAIRTMEKAGSTAEAAALQYTTLREAFARIAAEWDGYVFGDDVSVNWNMFAEGADEVEAWARSIGLGADEALRLHDEGKLAETITAARNAAKNGTPATDALASAYADLASETANSTEMLKGWRALVDEIIGVPKSLTDRTIDMANAYVDFDEALKENGLSFDIWDEKGRANLSTLSTLTDRVLDAAEAYGRSNGGLEDAHKFLEMNREAILKRIEASGLDRAEAEKALTQMGFTKEALDKIWDGANNAQGAAEELTNNLNSIPGSVTTEISVSARFNASVDRLESLMNRLPGMNLFGGISLQGMKMHSGGVVPGGKADEVWRLLQGGEVVLSRDTVSRIARGGLGGPMVPVRPEVVVGGHAVTERDLVMVVVDGANRMQSRSVAPLMPGVSG